MCERCYTDGGESPGIARSVKLGGTIVRDYPTPVTVTREATLAGAPVSRPRAVKQRVKPILARAWELGLQPRPDVWGRPSWQLREPKDPSKGLPPGVWEVKQ
jgi:hypothetical protein